MDSKVDSYADDTTISATAKTVTEISSTLTQDCNRVSEWMMSNRLKLNPGKTHVMTVGTEARVRNLTEKLEVIMDSTLLQEDESKCELLLGCQIQANLKWKKQVSDLISKLSKRLVGLLKLKYVVPFHMRKAITEGIFNSVLVYCLPLFGGMEIGDLKVLQVMQNKAARIVTHSQPRVERSPMYDRLQWLTVNQLIVYHSILNVFKLRNNMEPKHLAGIMCQDSRNKRILIPNLDLTLAQKSFTLRAAENWNKMPLHLRSNLKIGAFKKLASLGSWSKTSDFLYHRAMPRMTQWTTFIFIFSTSTSSISPV